MSKLRLLSTYYFCCCHCLLSSFFLATHAHAFCDPNNSEYCDKFESHGLRNHRSNKFHLREGVNAAMNQALDALKQVKLQQLKSQFRPLNVRERMVLSDCRRLYESTISRLNQTLDHHIQSTSFDTQIWLSAALTNLETCQESLTELNVMHPVFLSKNVSELISRSLAINAQLMDKNTREKGFHSWSFARDFSRSLQLSKDSADAVVAQDGSGNYRTIKEALDASSKMESGSRFVIHIKRGIYNEYLEITSEMKNIMLVGDGMGKTVITGDKGSAAGDPTFESATVKVWGDGFVAREITFRNNAGADGGQAVAVFTSSDQSVFYRCALEGYQDTLWAYSNRQFYLECVIYGTIDFIFGNAAVVIQNSKIYARKPPQVNQPVVITAQGRTSPTQPTGISIVDSQVLPHPSLKQQLHQHPVYLGRPWKAYARVVYSRSYLHGMITPSGWLDWNNKATTVYYAEYANYGPGSSTIGRVKWPGYRRIADANEARKFSAAEFINGSGWIPQAGVPFYDDLSD